jgi:hypothetical protein
MPLVLVYFNRAFGHYTKVPVESRESAMDIIMEHGDRDMGFSVVPNEEVES